MKTLEQTMDFLQKVQEDRYLAGENDTRVDSLYIVAFIYNKPLLTIEDMLYSKGTKDATTQTC